MIVLVSDYILGGPSVIQPPEMPAQPSKKESEQEPGEEHNEEDNKEETVDRNEDNAEDSGLRKRVSSYTLYLALVPEQRM